ncbi:MAG: hypothetical protein CMK09_14805 [Ponticaulis sp.]|nr:hypothetical protein [Ponticaulis sp.]|tara:strand:+ start:32429 stop:33925 length:1497 start_codon:yes stop_codon:yes gene_type:complete
MPADDGWTTSHTSASAVTSVADAPYGRPQLSLADLVVSIWRSKFLIAFVTIPFVILAVIAAMMMPVKYIATSRVQVTAGAERVFDPIVGQVQNAVLGQEEITESEVELLYSPVIFDRVIRKLGLEVIDPSAQAAMEKAPPTEQPLLYERAIESLQKSFSAGAAPKNPVIRTSFQHEDPQVAADVLNTIIETYLEYRADLFTSSDRSVLTRQRESLMDELALADAALERFLVDNRIGDFDTEKTSVASNYSRITDELLQVQAQKSEVDGRLGALTAQLSLTEPTIDLYVETNYQQQLLDLRIQREGLLSTYLPDTPQVQAIDRQIENVQTLISNQGEGMGTIRRGPNEVFQALDQKRAELDADSSALKTRFDELRRQKNQIERRQLELIRLEPKYQELVRDRAILDNQLRSLTVREGEERLKREVTMSDFDNIQILEPARPPSRGKSMKKVIAAAGLLFGGFTGLIVALIVIFSRNTMPTAGSIGRTTGLPVLSSVRAM